MIIEKNNEGLISVHKATWPELLKTWLVLTTTETYSTHISTLLNQWLAHV